MRIPIPIPIRIPSAEERRFLQSAGERHFLKMKGRDTYDGIGYGGRYSPAGTV